MMSSAMNDLGRIVDNIDCRYECVFKTYGNQGLFRVKV